jgi:acetoin utilization deacetylase AcuC-like enzyme
MQTLQLFYCDNHEFPLPAGHKFPRSKYRLLREQIELDPRFSLTASEYAPRQALLGAHCRDYVDAFLAGTIAPSSMRRIGFPWSQALVNRTLASVGGTLLATESALEKGFGGNLAGGTHHAFRNEGAGFCVFNDLAVAIECARADHGIRRAAVIDLDVHQGDGTAAIFAGDPDVFTFSMHAASNFPFRKQKSALDIELPDGTTDQVYLEKLHASLVHVWDFQPDLVFFQSGVDALESDTLGRLSLTRAGLMERNCIVLNETKRRHMPVVVSLGGGYSDPIALTVDAHADTFQAAADIYVGLCTL